METDRLTKAAARAKINARLSVAVVKANGGWKYRERIRLPDEDVARLGPRAESELVNDMQRYAVARELLEQMGRGEYFKLRCKELGL